MPKIIKSC